MKALSHDVTAVLFGEQKRSPHGHNDVSRKDCLERRSEQRRWKWRVRPGECCRAVPCIEGRSIFDLEMKRRHICRVVRNFST